MKTIVYLAVLIVISSNLYSLDTTSSKLFPLKTGNVYVYAKTSNSGFNGYYRAVIVKDTIINSHKYFFCRSFPYIDSGWVRVDTATGSLVKFDPSNLCPPYNYQKIIDSLSFSIVGGIVNHSCLLTMLIDTNNSDIFGNNNKSKRFGMGGYSSAYYYRYIRDIGLTYYRNEHPNLGLFSQFDLMGAVINGVVYGDTSITGLNSPSSRIPDKYALFQNYPNPFNPVTKIKFSLPSPSQGGVMAVKLVVYDILGREIANLIPPLWGGQEGLKPGSYEIEWDGTNYPSGVYFYKLITDNVILTKKMVLVK